MRTLVLAAIAAFGLGAAAASSAAAGGWDGFADGHGWRPHHRHVDRDPAWHGRRHPGHPVGPVHVHVHVPPVPAWPVVIGCGERPGPFASPVRPITCGEAHVGRGVVYNAPVLPPVWTSYGTAVIRARY